MSGNPQELLAKLECLSKWTNEEIREAFGKSEISNDTNKEQGE